MLENRDVNTGFTGIHRNLNFVPSHILQYMVSLAAIFNCFKHLLWDNRNHQGNR